MDADDAVDLFYFLWNSPDETEKELYLDMYIWKRYNIYQKAGQIWVKKEHFLVDRYAIWPTASPKWLIIAHSTGKHSARMQGKSSARNKLLVSTLLQSVTDGTNHSQLMTDQYQKSPCGQAYPPPQNVPGPTNPITLESRSPSSPTTHVSLPPTSPTSPCHCPHHPLYPTLHELYMLLRWDSCKLVKCLFVTCSSSHRRFWLGHGLLKKCI